MPCDMVIFGLAVCGKNSAAWTEALHKEVCRMRKKNFKGRCEKRVIAKCSEVCRTYDPIQYAYADVLQKDDTVREIRCNVLLDGLDTGEYTSDFICVKTYYFFIRVHLFDNIKANEYSKK